MIYTTRAQSSFVFPEFGEDVLSIHLSKMTSERPLY